MDTAQKFSLGTLVAADGSISPDEVKVDIQGRGIFCRIALEFSFSDHDPSGARFFVVDRPWNSVLVKAELNGEKIDKKGLWAEPNRPTLPAALRLAVSEVLQEGAPEFVGCYLEPGHSLRTMSLEFVIACDVLWHCSELTFVANGSQVNLEIEVNWDLSGLPGAGLECLDQAREGRFAALDASRRQWSDRMVLQAQERVGIQLMLDEKKAASICLYSRTNGREMGCGAVVVVAPVRPQLLRKPVRVAVVVEVRNPQEGLLARELVDQLSGALGPEDQIAIYILGSTANRCLMDWKSVGEVHEEELAQLLDPSFMGRAQFFWDSFQRVLEECQGATQVLLCSPGPRDQAPDDFVCHLPVFCHATGRKPYTAPLDDLAGKTGGFVSEHLIDGISSFLQRLNIRLSPPLLRDFRLEGWGLEKVYPPGLTQVYTDKPTLVLGLYDGLLPQTVTLGGLSPAGQKLAQRVRVETFHQFDLMPLFEERSKPRLSAEQSVKGHWSDEKFTLLEAIRPVQAHELFVVEEAESVAHDPFGPPSIDIVPQSAVTLDDPFAASDDFFSAHSDSGATLTDDFFSSTSSNEPSFLDQPVGEADPFLAPPPVIQFDDEPEPLPRISFGSGESLPGPEEELDPPTEEPDLFEGEFSSTLQYGPASFDEQEPDQSSLPPDDFFEPSSPSPALDGLARPEYLDPEPLSATNEPTPKEPSLEALPPAGRLGGSQERPPAGRPIMERVVPASAEVEPPPVVRPPAPTERPTLTVVLPEWVRRLSDLEPEAVVEWIATCPIDHLALALADTEVSLASSFLQRLDDSRRKAVELQIELGRLLPEEERAIANERLGESLEQFRHLAAQSQG